MRTKFYFWVVISVVLLPLFGCDNMREGNRIKPYEETPFFENGNSSRDLIDGTVPRGFLNEDAHLYKGMTDTGEFSSAFPFPITEQVLARGKERYEIYCLVCHGVTGAGDGMVVRRGYTKPQPLQADRLKKVPAGYLFHVTGEGYGDMAGFKSELTPEDRWAVTAYIRALQNMKNE